MFNQGGMGDPSQHVPAGPRNPVRLGRRQRRPRVSPAELALRAANLALEEQLLQSRKLETVGTLAGGLAHDLNNVLGAILALAAGARANPGDPGALASSLEAIQSACERGREVVGDLLRFLRREAGTQRPVSLNEIAREVARWLSPERLKGVGLVLELEEGVPPVMGERGALCQAVMNLCVNALDAMPAGGTLTLRSLVGARGEVRLGVRDTGTGMAPELAERALEAFFTTKPSGTGLGLPLVAATMRTHGGSVELASRLGEGTAVFLVFPPAPAALVRAPARALRLLVVDDDEALRGALCTLLADLGHTVSEAPGGLEALALFEAGLAVDLVLLDLNMPGFSGAQTLPRILELRPGQRVLLVSGADGRELAAFAASYPTAAGIAKPFRLEELQRRMADLLEG